MVIVAASVFTISPHVVSAAPASTPACNIGVGIGGTRSNTIANTIGGHGCVVVKYASSGAYVYDTFNYTGSDQTWTVPSGVTYAYVYLLGAGGGGSDSSHATYKGGNGGGGGYVEGEIAVTPGSRYTIIVGQAGGGVSPVSLGSNVWRTPATYGGGGRGGSIVNFSVGYASGGGRSAIRVQGASSDLVTAGGGGGAGSTPNTVSGGDVANGAVGGGTTGGTSGATRGGAGGTQSAGGAGGTSGYGAAYNGTAGTQYLGGNSNDEGGGGGGGWFGGGGGADPGSGALVGGWGGGGGSSYVALVANGTTNSGSNTSPGGSINALAENSPAPTDVAGTSGDTEVSLSWTAPVVGSGPAISDYVIQYSSNNGSSWVTFSDGTSSATSTTVTGLTNGTIYVFRVSATDGTNVSRYSEVSLGVVPRAPTVQNGNQQVINVLGTPGNASVALTWTAPNSNLPLTFGSTGDASISLGNLGGGNSAANNDCPTDYAITGIGTGTSNNIVQARCTKINSDGTLNASLTSTLTWFSGGASRWSYCSTGKVATSIRGGSNWLQSMSLKCATPPAVSDSVELTSWPATSSGTTVDSACPAGQIVKGFYARSGAWIDAVRSRCATFGTAPFSNYLIQYSSDSGTTWTAFSRTASTATSGSVTGLTNGTAYHFRVAHVSAGTTGTYSDPSPAYIPFTSPSAPLSLTGERGDTQVDLTWLAPASDNGRDISDYVVQFSSNNGSTWTTFSDGVSTTTSATVTGLTNGTSYLFRVAAVNLAGTGTYSANSSALIPATVPNAPTALTATFGSTSVALAWTAPSTGGTAITDYVVQYSTDNSTWTTFSDTVSTTASVTVTGLTNYSTYYFRVAAINAVGTGAYSSSVTSVPGITPGNATPTVASTGSTQIGLSWTIHPTGASSVTDWLVQYSTNNSTWTTFNDGVSTTTSVTVTGLTNGTLYYFRVAPINPATMGAFGNSASATPRTVPNAPIITTLTPGNTQVVVAWSAPATGGSAITDYDLEYSSNSGSTWTAWASGTTSNATSVTVTGLTNGTAYVFRVLAKNAAGSSTNSSTSSSSTPRTVPTITGQPVLTAGDRQILVSWTAPTSNGGSAITGYGVERYPFTAGCACYGLAGVAVPTATSFMDTGLTNGSQYFYRVYAINAAGNGVVSERSYLAGTPVGTMVAPTNIVGTAGNAQVALTWTAPAANGGTISDYTIQYSSNSGSTWTTFSDTVSATASVTVTGLTNGTAYVFRVAATNQAGLGAYSASSAARTPVGAPGAPTNLVGVAGNAQVALTWTAPVSNGGSAITDYIIEYSINNGSSWLSYSDTVSTATSLTTTGVTNGVAHIYRVAARNAVGTGSFSTSSATQIAFTVPNAPTSVSASTGARQSTVTWTAPASNGGSAITGYAVRFSVVNSNVWSTATLTGSTLTSFTQTGLTPTTSYIFQVAAINAAGQGAWSANSSSVLIQDFAAAPTNVAGVAGNTQVALTWTAPTSNGGNAISNYDVQYSSNSGSTWTSFSHTASTATSLTVTGLTNGVDYLFRVAAINGWGRANFATTPTTYNPFTLPGAPTNVVGAAGSSQAVVTWTASAPNGRTITDYIVQFSSNNGTTWATFNDGTSTATSATVTGLTNSVAYIFKVAGVSAAGTSSYSSNTSAVTPQAVPSTPLNVVGVGGNTQVSLSWTAPLSNGGRAVTDYDIQYSSNSGSTWTTFTDSVSSATSAVVTGLTNGTSYIFQVSAKNSVGTGGYSVASTAVIPFTVPGQPTSVSGVAGVGQVALSWTAPTSDGGSPLTDYVVEYSTNSGTTWITFADSVSTTASVTVTGLVNGTGYVFRVSARNTAGTGLPSSSSSSVVPRTAPSAAQSVVGVSGNAQVVLSWSAPSSTGGNAISDYVVQYSSDGTNWTTFTDSVSSTASCTVTGLTNGTAYTFRVAAVNAGGTGTYSVVSAAVTPFTTPDAPTAVAGVSGNAQVVVSWTAPADNGGSAIIQYQVSYAPQGTDNYGTWSTATATQSSSTTFTVPGLTNGTSYKFKVAATNAAGDGSYSTSSSAVTAYTTPGAPTAVTGTAGEGEVALSWSAPTSNGGDSITDYIIQYSSNNGASWTTFSDGTSTSTSETVTGLTNGSSYVFRIAAVNAAGAGANSTNSAAVVPRTVPDAPFSATATAANEQVTLSWSAPVFNGGTAITDYFIEYSEDGTTWALFSDGTSTLRATAVTGLSNGTPYYFRVYAINSVGMGLPSAPSSPVTPLTSPTAPTISRIDTSNALLTVYFSPGDDGGNPITSYQYSTDGGATWQTRTVGSTSSPLVISALSTNGTSALANGTTYSVQIRAVNSAGAGNASLTTTATPVTVPTAPLSVVATPGNASISLNWTAPSSNGGTAITDYEVEYSTNGGSTWFSFINGTSTATSASITSLTNGTSYTFRVSAVNSAGMGVASVWSTSVAPRTVPSAPTNLAISSGAGSIDVSWSAASSGGSTITDFIVEYSTDGSSWITFNDGLSTSTSTTITGLTNGTPYYVRVSAVNVAGSSTAVVSGSTATPKTTPGAPSVSAIAAGNQSLSVSFTAGTNGGSTITGYQYSINGGSTWTTATGTSSPITISGLTNGTSYQVALRAVNIVGNGDTSNILASTPRTVPNAPTISSITAGANQGSVAFTLSGNGGSAVTDYEYRVNAGSWSAWISAGTTTSPLVVANLVNGTAYDVQIRAVNIAGAGNGSSSSSVTPFSSPGSPTITGVAAGRGQVVVSFAAGVTGGSAITNYQYSTDGGTTWIALSPASTSSPFTVTGLADSTTYNIQLKAVNVAGAGAASSAVAATTWGVPEAPAIVSSTARDGALDVAFVSGANGGDSISNYEYSIDGGATWITRNPASIVSPLVISGLTNGTTYPVQLRAVNSVGASSASATATLKPHAVPSAPVITNQSAASQTISIAFTAGADGGEEILGYEYSTDRGATWYPRTDSGGTTSPMTITKLSTNGTTNLTNGTTYNVQVRAISLVGNGAASADVAGTPATTPSAPTNLEVVNGDRYLLASFIPGSNGGAAISSYQYSTDNGSTWRTAAATTSPLTITTASSDGVSALNNGTAYTVLVRAVNAQGAGTASSSVSGTPRTNPDAPGSVVVSAGDATISVAFVANANDGGNAVTGYEYSTDGGATWRLRDPGTSMTSSPITITKLSSDGLTALTNGVAYNVLIRAVNTSGPGKESATQTAIPASAPSAPAITSITPGDKKLSVAFSAGNNGGNAVVRNEYSLDGGSTWISAPSLNSPIVITGLSNGTAYALQVRQVNALGNGASSVTVEGIPCTIPAAPTVNQVIAGNATLSVDFSSGATGGSDITSYQYSTDGGATWSNRAFGSTESPLSITTQSSDGVTALVNGTFYSVKIRAVNSAGSGVASESVRIAPLTVPSAPVISSVAMRNSFALLTFSVASDGGSPVTAYEYSLNAGISWTNASSLANPMRISGLRNGSNYSVIIRALNIAGAGDSSATSSIAPIGPPDAPRITTLTPSDQTLGVAFVDGATSGSPIIGYEYSIDGGNTWPSAGSATGSPFTITGLTNGTIYTVRIRAVNANGSGTSSDPVVSKPYTVPSAPIITQIDVDGNDATLAYTAPASNGGQAITSYEYSIDNGSSWVSTNSPTVMSVQISNLVEDQDYQVGVRAVNSAGPGAVATVSTQSVIVVPTNPTTSTTSTTVPQRSSSTTSTTVPPRTSGGSAPEQSTTTTTTQPKSPISSVAPVVPAAPTEPTGSPTASVTQNPTQLEVLPGSGGIAVPPGRGAVVIDGKIVDLIVTVAQDGVAIIEFPGEFVVRITPRNADGTIIPPGEGSAIRAFRGRTVEVGGEGFAPNSVVEVWVNSEPIFLGNVTTDAEGRFSKVFDLPVGLLPGQHTLTLGGTTKKGQVVKASVGLIVEEDAIVSQPISEIEKPVESYDPRGDAAGTMTLIVNALVLLAIAGSASRKEDEDEDRGSGDVSDVSVKSIGVDGEGADRLRLPRISLADRIMARTPEATAHRSPMIGRVLQDGTYLRSLFGALWLLLPIAGVALGIASAFNTNFEVVMPSLALLSAIVVIGTLDAFAGFLGAITFAVAVVAGGGINSADSIRGLLGIWVLSFAVPMLASASRPFRRKNANGIAGAWDRSTDFILILLFGALAAGSMFSSLPGLTGFRPEFAGNVAHIQIVAMCVLAARFMLENATVKLTPTRYRELTDLALRDASNVQQIVSSLIRTVVYLFVAEVFIGNNWALWVGGVLYLAPKLVGLVVDKFPNIESLHRWMPRGILKVTVMMLLARVWGVVLTDAVSDPAQMIMFSFVFMGTPGLVATVLGWFGRTSSRPWPQTWFTRVAGLFILIIGILMVRGVLFAF